MNRKKTLIEEEVKKVWTLANLIREAAPVASGQVAPTTAPVGQPAPNSQNPPQPGTQPGAQQPNAQAQQIDKNAKTALSQALAITVKDLPAILKNFVATVGDKDNQLDAAGITPANAPAATANAPAATTQKPATQQSSIQPPVAQTNPQIQKESTLTFDENKFKEHAPSKLDEAGLLGLVLSAPAIVGLAGKAAMWTGKKLNAQWLQKSGHWAEELGHTWHQAYINTIKAAIKPLMPGVDDKKVSQTAEALLMVVVGTIFAGGIGSPDALTGVKGKEIASYAHKILPTILSKVGFA